ncbi:uncharacterized protein LOC115716483 [Cannabis sativa]|uniref:Uncharacterized protein n=1 Tax=Cannabis sativa TaxID=3483 RepID=A0A7J6EI02_CANSA|nr:uncharacterized protein LOC115716483 [Cannabis sativa]KAF4358022.1 hypothetical protein F8388_008530 [Cannabis sativa]
MRFLRRIAGFLGFVKDDGHEVKDEEDDDDDAAHNTSSQARNRTHFKESGLPRKGFSVPVQVSVDRSLPGPILAPSDSGDGGVQGLKWYAKRLRIDEDGDVADEFIDEVTRESLSMNTEHEKKPLPKFQAKYGTRPAKVQKQVVLPNGRLQQYVEHQGRLQLV